MDADLALDAITLRGNLVSILVAAILVAVAMFMPSQPKLYSITTFGLASDGPIIMDVPTPEPSAVVVPVGTPATLCGEWECILREVGWPEYAIPDALRISLCESGWRDVQNKEGGPYWGRFQIAFTTAGYHQDKLIQLGYPPTVESLLDPYINARVALLIWQEEGWSPWECQ